MRDIYIRAASRLPKYSPESWTDINARRFRSRFKFPREARFPAPILPTTAFSISKRPTQPSTASNVHHPQDNYRLRRLCNTYCCNGRLDLRLYKTRGHQKQCVPAKGQDSRDPLKPLLSSSRLLLPPGTRTLLSHTSRPAPEPFELS